MNAKNGMRPVHPGKFLREELDELGLPANALSKALGVPVNRVTMILNGQRGVSADTALRISGMLERPGSRAPGSILPGPMPGQGVLSKTAADKCM